MSRIGVVVFPGSNCELDVKWALESLGAEAELVWHRDKDLSGLDGVVLPGGFAHGDYLRTGAIARFSPVMRGVEEMAAAGRPVVGICNGFQILCEAGLLPGSLLRNASLRFRSHDTFLRVERTDTLFTSLYTEGQVLRMPLSHGEGNYHADTDTLDRLEAERRIVFRYVGPGGEEGEAYNPNGSDRDIAGIVNEAGNVLGMMPHPDRAMEAVLGSADGRPLFRSLVENLTSAPA